MLTFEKRCRLQMMSSMSAGTAWWTGTQNKMGGVCASTVKRRPSSSPADLVNPKHQRFRGRLHQHFIQPRYCTRFSPAGLFVRINFFQEVFQLRRLEPSVLRRVLEHRVATVSSPGMRHKTCTTRQHPNKPATSRSVSYSNTRQGTGQSAARVSREVVPAYELDINKETGLGQGIFNILTVCGSPIHLADGTGHEKLLLATV